MLEYRCRSEEEVDGSHRQGAMPVPTRSPGASPSGSSCTCSLPAVSSTWQSTMTLQSHQHSTPVLIRPTRCSVVISQALWAGSANGVSKPDVSGASWADDSTPAVPGRIRAASRQWQGGSWSGGYRRRECRRRRCPEPHARFDGHCQRSDLRARNWRLAEPRPCESEKSPAPSDHRHHACARS